VNLNFQTFGIKKAIIIIRARNIEEDQMGSTELVSTYKSLAKVESAFRRLKTTTLLVLPTFRYEGDMGKAHIFLCMLAYYVQWEMEHQLAPLLFCEEDPAAAEALRASPVAPAQRSESAKKKEQGKRSADANHPVQSFRSLLENLATLTRATCRPKIAGAETYLKYTQAPTLQQEAYRLLDQKPPGR